MFIAAVLLIVQIPFAYRAWQISSIATKIAFTNPQPPITSRADGLKEYIGLLHVHSVHSGEISDAYDEMLDAACDNHLDFIILTEHYSTAFDTSAATLNGWYGSMLFVAGNEINSRDGDRLLMVPGGPEAAGFRIRPTGQVVDAIHSKGDLAIAAYPEKFTAAAWDAPFDGIEVANLNTMLRHADPVTAAFDLVWSAHVDRALTIARHLSRADENLKRFDEVAATRKIFMTGGTDAHSALGVYLIGDELGERWIAVKLDPHAEIFRIVRLHVLTDKPLEREALLQAIKSGSFFVGFDVLGDSRGFNFVAESGDQRSLMGTEVSLIQGLKLRAASPIAAKIVLLRDGERIAENANATELVAGVTQPGEYRVEVYRGDLGSDFAKIPWILSNPIFVR